MKCTPRIHTHANTREDKTKQTITYTVVASSSIPYTHYTYTSYLCFYRFIHVSSISKCHFKAIDSILIPLFFWGPIQLNEKSKWVAVLYRSIFQMINLFLFQNSTQKAL